MSVAIDDTGQPALPPRPWKQAVWRGLRRRCPNCGTGTVFASFLKIADRCGDCGEELHHQRADDAPPYFTIMIVGHIIVPSVLLVERFWRPDLIVHFALWLPATLLLTLLLMPRVKGAIVGLQWALRMHGFGEEPGS
jgi:uncharacterized protein (DUF983 family)